MKITPVSQMPVDNGSVVETARVQASAAEENFAAQLKKAVEKKNEIQLRQAAQEMEALFIQLLWKELRGTIPKSGLIPRGMAEDVFEGMLDEEYAKEAAKAGGLGLAEVLYQQLSAETGKIKEETMSLQDKGKEPRNTSLR